MKGKIFFVLAIFFFIVIGGFKYVSKEKATPIKITRSAIFKNKLIIQCSPDWSMINADSLANSIGVLPGWGNYRWNISTKNDSAQFYFNQGINMYYAFHIIESMASFKRAQLFDDNNAMIYWAQGLAYGPNINDFAYASTPDAYEAVQKALALSGNASVKEKALIQAMSVRYSNDSTVSRESLNQLYTDAMSKAYKLFKQDADVAALYADAMMLQHPWDYWKHNGNAQPWTPKIISVIENALKIAPIHPGVNHYYIHMVEASSNPQRAMASADRLGKLMPGVSHMIHMPSHIYIRSGKYKRGIEVNEMSVKGYNTYLALYPEVQNNLPLYLIHNLHMQSACAMMRANYSYSNKSSIECQNSFDTSFLSLPQPLGNFVQYMYMTPAINNVRFGKWDEILNAAPQQSHHIYAVALSHWARGMAFAGKNKIAEAKMELNSLQEKIKESDMQIVMQPFNSPASAAKVAEKILAGTIAEKQKDFVSAIKLFREAVKNEAALIYNEPRDWMLPARQYLGNALLEADKLTEAEKIFREDLKENPNNHWSLYGLYKALSKQNKTIAATIIKTQFNKAFENADIPIGQAVF
ncbi:MAG: hypothetical protein V4556_00280 [Bacteroidota bacterium]